MLGSDWSKRKQTYNAMQCNEQVNEIIRLPVKLDEKQSTQAKQGWKAVSQTPGHQAHYHHITNGSGNGNGNIQVDQFIDLGIKLNDKLSEDNWVHVVCQQVQKAPISL